MQQITMSEGDVSVANTNRPIRGTDDAKVCLRFWKADRLRRRIRRRAEQCWEIWQLGKGILPVALCSAAAALQPTE
jgi:hypothetical protein